jgi:hypothetical protein
MIGSMVAVWDGTHFDVRIFHAATTPLGTLLQQGSVLVMILLFAILTMIYGIDYAQFGGNQRSVMMRANLMVTYISVPIAGIDGRSGSGLGVLGDELHRIAVGLDGFRGIVRDLDAEFLLERHHQLDGIEAVGAEIVDERGALGDLVLLDAQVLHHDLFDALCDIAHLGSSLSRAAAAPVALFSPRAKRGLCLGITNSRAAIPYARPVANLNAQAPPRRQIIAIPPLT